MAPDEGVAATAGNSRRDLDEMPAAAGAAEATTRPTDAEEVLAVKGGVGALRACADADRRTTVGAGAAQKMETGAVGAALRMKIGAVGATPTAAGVGEIAVVPLPRLLFHVTNAAAAAAVVPQLVCRQFNVDGGGGMTCDSSFFVCFTVCFIHCSRFSTQEQGLL
jgi:hypothetical protein